MYVSSHTTLYLEMHKRWWWWWWWWCVFLSKRKKEEDEGKELFISSFEVDALNGTEVSSTMMMNIRSAFLGWCCVFSTTKWGIIKLTRERERIVMFISSSSLSSSSFSSLFSTNQRSLNDVCERTSLVDLFPTKKAEGN